MVFYIGQYKSGFNNLYTVPLNNMSFPFSIRHNDLLYQFHRSYVFGTEHLALKFIEMVQKEEDSVTGISV